MTVCDIITARPGIDLRTMLAVHALDHLRHAVA